MDTVTGYFSVGLIPTGSADPYQLRRAALGVIRILEAFNMPFTFEELERMSAERHGDIAGNENSRRKLVDFFEERYRNYMVTAGYAHDVMEALAARKAPLAKKREAADAITAMKDSPEFRDFREVFTRISNIMSKSKPAVGREVNPDLFQADEERALREAWLKVKPALEDGGATEEDKLKALFSLSTPGAAFFDKVLVMDKDENVRENRGVMLFEILTGITENSADFKLIVKK
jgi:glycyl-tRNA synthetase beta chain